HTIAEPVRESILEMFKTKLSKEEVNEMTANITRTFYEEKEQAEQRGVERGREKGREEEKLSIARALLDVLDDEIIGMKTGLSAEKVASLRRREKKS
ncbi:MAG: hypothetical protein ACRDDX_11570, partial [Cellulosilyticaceae bacterium]